MNTRNKVWSTVSSAAVLAIIGLLALGAGEAVAHPAQVQTADPGVVTYTLLDDQHIYRIVAAPESAPEDITAALDVLAPGESDEWLNIAPDGRWLLLSTDRFDPQCAGWPCLTLLAPDLSVAEVVALEGAPLHAEGFAAVASLDESSDDVVVVYALDGGPHARDLWAVTRTAQAWGAPVLLTGESPFEYHHQPALSADGTHVVFDCGDEPYAEPGTAICEAATDGSAFEVLLRPPAGDFALHHPDYGPDGRLVFESNAGGGEAIWQWDMATEGSTPEQLGDFGNDNSPCALPDGRIVSLWLEGPANPNGLHEIKVMDPSASPAALLLRGADVLDGGLGCGVHVTLAP